MFTRRAIARSFAAVALGATVLTGLPGTATAATSAAVTDFPDAMGSPTAYVDYLDAQAGLGDTGATALAEQFKALSPDKQARYLDLAGDPTYVGTMLGMVNEDGWGKVVLAGGDVVVKQSFTSAEGAPEGEMRASAVSRWASHTVSVYYLGLRATSVTVRTNYATSGTDTTTVYPGSAWHTNYIAGTNLSRTAVSRWISPEPADNAHSETVWTFEWWTGIEDTGRHRVWADYSGFKGGYLKT